MLEMKVQLSATDELIAAMRSLASAFAEDSKAPEPTATINTAPINTPVNPITAQDTQSTATPAAMPAVAETAAAPTVPTSAPQYTLDMIATAGSALIDAGKMDQLMGLLGKFGVASLTELAPESYGAVANELRALGAAI
jgi:hypothetical protein